jgi:hypothetical protein
MGIFKQSVVLCNLLCTQDCKYKHAYILLLFNEATCGTYVIPIAPIHQDMYKRILEYATTDFPYTCWPSYT